MVQKSYLASVKILGDKIEINTKNIGTSYIYLWFEDGMNIYNLKVDLPKEVKTKTKNNNQLKDPNSAQGKYSFSASEGISEKDKFQINKKRDFIHNINYETPFGEGRVYFNSLVKTNFDNYINLNSLSLQNINIKYAEKKYSFSLGNIYSLNSDEKGLLEGINFNYDFNALDNISFYAGLGGIDEINLYKNNTTNLDNTKKLKNYLDIGLNGKYNPFSWLQLNSSLGANISFDNSEKKYFTNLNYKIKPLDNLSLLGSIKTNFQKITIANDFYYKQEFFNNFNFLETLLAQSYENEFNKITNQNLSLNSNNNISVVSRLKHESETDLTFKYSYSNNKKDISNNINVKTSKEIIKNAWKINASYYIKKFNAVEEKSYNFGSNISLKQILPFDMSYLHTGIIDKENLNIENLDINYRVFANNFLSLDLNNNTNYTFNFNSNKLNKNSILNTLSLASNANFNDFSFGTTIGYIKQFDEKNNIDKLFFKLNSNLNITPTNQINFQTSMSKVINGSLEVSSNVNYNYTFGSIKEKKGKITGIIFDDENGNGSFDKGEKTFSNIELSIANKIIKTNNLGEYSVNDLDYGDYQINIKNESLPKNYKALSSQENISLEKEEYKQDFIFTNKVAVKGYIYASNKKNKGVAGVQVNLDNIQNLTSDEDGYFAVKAVPGLHIFQVDYNTIPKNYTMKTNPTQKINVEENNENSVEFILNPIRIIKGIVHKKNDTSSKLENIKVEISHFSKEELIKKEEIKSDEDGEFIISEFEGDSIEIKINGAEQEVQKFEIEENPFKKELLIPIN